MDESGRNFAQVDINGVSYRLYILPKDSASRDIVIVNHETKKKWIGRQIKLSAATQKHLLSLHIPLRFKFLVEIPDTSTKDYSALDGSNNETGYLAILIQDTWALLETKVYDELDYVFESMFQLEKKLAKKQTDVLGQARSLKVEINKINEAINTTNNIVKPLPDAVDGVENRVNVCEIAVEEHKQQIQEMRKVMVDLNDNLLALKNELELQLPYCFTKVFSVTAAVQTNATAWTELTHYTTSVTIPKPLRTLQIILQVPNTGTGNAVVRGKIRLDFDGVEVPGTCTSIQGPQFNDVKLIGMVNGVTSGSHDIKLMALAQATPPVAPTLFIPQFTGSPIETAAPPLSSSISLLGYNNTC